MTIDETPTTPPADVVLKKENPHKEENQLLINKITERYPHAFIPLPDHDGVLYLARPHDMVVPVISVNDQGGALAVDTVFLSAETGIYISNRPLVTNHFGLQNEGPVELRGYDTFLNIVSDGTYAKNSNVENGFKNLSQNGFDQIKQCFDSINRINESRAKNDVSSDFVVEFNQY